MVGVALTSLSLLMMGFMALFPQSSVEDFALSLITAACLLGSGAIILTLVSDYALILSSAGIFLLLLFWRLRNLDPTWLLVLSFLCFVLSLVVHRGSLSRRTKGRRTGNRRGASRG